MSIEAATEPKSERLIYGEVFAKTYTVTDGDVITAENELGVYGPLYVKLIDDAGNSGVQFLDRDGTLLARVDSRGILQITGILITADAIPDYATVEGFLWQNNAGTYVAHLDTSGNLTVIAQPEGIETMSLVENAEGIGTFPTSAITMTLGPFPRMVFIVNDADIDTPILQVLNNSGDCVWALKQDGTIQFPFTGGIFGGASAYRSTVHGGV